MQDLLQGAVVRSNAYWPFSRLNRQAYKLATAAFVRSYRSFPEIRSIYLRHSLLGNDWVPGLSDVDLTVVTAAGLGPDEGFAFLQRFWRRFARLKRFVPMLGEVDVLQEDQLSSWTRYTIRGHESSRWQRLHGAETLVCTYNSPPQEIARDSVTQGLTTYLGHFLPRFLKGQGGGFVEAKLLERIACKAARYALSAERSPVLQRGTNTADPMPALLAQVLEALATGVRGLQLDNEGQAEAEDWFESPAAPVALCRDDSTWLNALEDPAGAIESVLYSPSKWLVLIADPCSLDDATRAVAFIRDAAARAGVDPLILNRPLLGHYVRNYQGPYSYVLLARNRSLLRGQDPLPVRPGPSRRDAIRCILNQTGNALAFARCRDVALPAKRDWFLSPRLRSILSRGLLICLYLERNEVWPSSARASEAWHQYFPDEVHAMDDLEARVPHDDVGALARRCFRLFSGVSERVHRAVAAAASESKPDDSVRV